MASDDQNPEWTQADFDQARGPETLPPHILDAFPQTARRVRGPQKTPTKTLVSLRLDQAVLDHFKAGGPGWQSRINDVLARETRRR